MANPFPTEQPQSGPIMLNPEAFGDSMPPDTIVVCHTYDSAEGTVLSFKSQDPDAKILLLPTDEVLLMTSQKPSLYQNLKLWREFFKSHGEIPVIYDSFIDQFNLQPLEHHLFPIAAYIAYIAIAMAENGIYILQYQDTTSAYFPIIRGILEKTFGGAIFDREYTKPGSNTVGRVIGFRNQARA